MYCPYCGNQLPDDARFCNGCGKRVMGETIEPNKPEPSESSGRAVKVVLILVIAVVAIVILVAGSMLVKSQVETQRAIRDAQQAKEEAEEERAKYGDVEITEESDETEDDETDEDPELTDDETEEDTVEEDGEAIVEEPAVSQAHADFEERLDALQAEFISGNPSADNATMTQAAVDLYQRSDALLNEIYQYIKANTDSDTFASIQQEERNWITQRDAKAEADAADWEGGSGYNLVYTSSLTESTLDRCDVLVEYVK